MVSPELPREAFTVGFVVVLLREVSLVIGHAHDVVVRILQDEMRVGCGNIAVVVCHDLVNVVEPVDVLAVECQRRAVVLVVLQQAVAVVVEVIPVAGGVKIARAGHGFVNDPPEDVVFAADGGAARLSTLAPSVV